MIKSIQETISKMTDEELGINEYAALSNEKGQSYLGCVIGSKQSTKEGENNGG